jgi:hypothetical protein
MKKVVVGLFGFLVVLVLLSVCGCEETDAHKNSDSNRDNYYGNNDSGRSITVRVENQSPYDIIVYKGDSRYATLESGAGVSVYAYLVSDQELSVAVSTPVFGVRKNFDRYDSYSNFVVYESDYSVESEQY